MAEQVVTGGRLVPDLQWLKRRSAERWHEAQGFRVMWDSHRQDLREQMEELRTEREILERAIVILEALELTYRERNK